MAYRAQAERPVTMIARDLRLRSELDFERVRSRGKTWTSRLIVLKVLPNELSQNRYGFAAGKRIGKAVARNRVKRLMREAARAYHPTLAEGYDLIFIARGGATALPDYQDILREVGELLQRAGLRHEARRCDDPSSG